MGDSAAAAQSLSEALSLAENIGSISEQSWLQAGLAETHLAMGTTTGKDACTCRT